MTVYELIRVLAQFEPDTEVYVSQQPKGCVNELLYHNFEDDGVKLYGDGEVDVHGDKSR